MNTVFALVVESEKQPGDYRIVGLKEDQFLALAKCAELRESLSEKVVVAEFYPGVTLDEVNSSYPISGMFKFSRVYDSMEKYETILVREGWMQKINNFFLNHDIHGF